MNNPGSFNDCRERNPELNDAEVLARYSETLSEWKSNIVVEETPVERPQQTVELAEQMREQISRLTAQVVYLEQELPKYE